MAVLSTKPLCTLKGFMRRTTNTEELKFHIQKAKCNLSRTSYSCVKGVCFAMQWSSKGQSTNSFAWQISSKTKRSQSKSSKQKFLRSDEGLTLETSAFESLYGGQFTLSTQLMKPTSHRRSTTVSLETYPSIQILYLLNILAYKKYQIKIPQCNINHILTNLSNRGRIPVRNSALLSASCTLRIGRHFRNMTSHWQLWLNRCFA